MPHLYCSIPQPFSTHAASRALPSGFLGSQDGSHRPTSGQRATDGGDQEPATYFDGQRDEREGDERSGMSVQADGLWPRCKENPESELGAAKSDQTRRQ